MSHSLLHEPEFDFNKFEQHFAEWKLRKNSQVEIEWSTGAGPSVFCYPVPKRSEGTGWKYEILPDEYSEVYADFIEAKILPRLAELVKSVGLVSNIRCVDQLPIQAQRQRRKEIELASSAH